MRRIAVTTAVEQEVPFTQNKRTVLKTTRMRGSLAVRPDTDIIIPSEAPFLGSRRILSAKVHEVRADDEGMKCRYYYSNNNFKSPSNGYFALFEWFLCWWNYLGSLKKFHHR